MDGQVFVPGTADNGLADSSGGIYERFRVTRVINARGYSTKLGGCRLPMPVLEAMRSAAGSCIRMEELQEAAGRVIADATGAESGIATSGASASLSLAAAACLTGLDVSKMNRLPDTSEFPNEIIVQKSHRNDYDHALRLAGARLVEAGFPYYTFPHDVESLITQRTVALFFLAGSGESGLSLKEFVAIAHRHKLPVIVDAAAALPPSGNLKTFIAQGADLVAYSGGKDIRGPQASGILCGRRDLILAAALQHQDMDVFPETWPMRKLMSEGLIASPPHHGIGRGFKVGKEEIVGLLVALQLYAQRDTDAVYSKWLEDIKTVVSYVDGLRGVTAEVNSPKPGDRPVPGATIRIDSSVLGFDANHVINQLQEGTPRIGVYETLASAGRIVLYPEAMQDGEASQVGKRLREILTVKDGAPRV